MAADAPARPAGGPLRRLLHTRVSGALLLVALLVLWEVSARWWVSSPNWPPVSAVLAAVVDGLGSGELPEVFGSSLYRMITGYVIGSLLAIAVGMAMALVRWIDAALEPAVELLRPIPIPAIIPPLVLLLGVDDKMKIFVIAFAAFFPVLVNTVGGVRAVEPVMIDVARTLRAGRWRTALRVVLPASMPYILAGLRISLALSLIVTVVAEMIAGSAGIGYYLMTMQYAMRSPDMYAAILVLAAIGYLLNRGFLSVEKRLLRWYER